MKEQILQIMERYPNGMRKREIAAHLKVWQCNADFLHAMYELESENKIYRELHRDFANMEYYDNWKLTK